MRLEPIIRPPSEADALILQPTYGCSHNRCAFCRTYQQRAFKARPLEEVLLEIDELAPVFAGVRKVFLGDGDPLALSTARLLPILAHIKARLPSVRRITAYASPSNFRNKRVEELARLRDAGLTQVYMGYESGDDAVLEMMNKGNTRADILSAADKLNEAGVRISAILILGVAGKKRSRAHAEASASVVNLTRPRFLSALTLMNPEGYAARIRRPEFRPLSVVEVLTECHRLIEHIDANGIIFRANHVSNHLALEGVLQKSSARLLGEIAEAVAFWSNKSGFM